LIATETSAGLIASGAVTRTTRCALTVNEENKRIRTDSSNVPAILLIVIE